MKKIVIFLFVLAFAASSVAQVSSFTLKSFDKSKTLDADAWIDLEVDITGDSLDYGSISYSGEFEDITEDGIILVPQNIYKELRGDHYDISYSKSFYDNSEAITIDPKTITSINYTSNAAMTVGGVSAVLAAAGYTAALLVAPLVSINYRTGDFNQDRYYKVAGAGLITFAVTIPIAVTLTTGRDFKMKDLFNFDEYSDGWEFDYENVERY